MDNCLECRIADYSLIKRSLFRNVLDNAEVELVLLVLWVCFGNTICLVLAAYCSDHAMSVLEQDVKNMGRNEAAATCKKDPHVCCFRCVKLSFELGWCYGVCRE